MKSLKRSAAFLAVAVAALAAAPNAVAGTATYNSTGPLFVPDGQVRTSTISVPSGRTAVQSVEVTNFTVFWPASAQELSTELIGTDGTFLSLFEIGCANFQAEDVWGFSDSATQFAFDDKFDPKCDLPGATFKPVDPALKKLSIFSGKQASGTWTLRATDNGAQFINSGSIQTWAVRIVHAPPTLTASAPKSSKLKKTLSLTAQSNADGTVVTGGDAKSDTTTHKAGESTKVSYQVKKKVRKKIERKGRALVKIKVDFTDATGDTASETVTIKLKANQK